MLAYAHDKWQVKWDVTCLIYNEMNFKNLSVGFDVDYLR